MIGSRLGLAMTVSRVASLVVAAAYLVTAVLLRGHEPETVVAWAGTRGRRASGPSGPYLA